MATIIFIEYKCNLTCALYTSGVSLATVLSVFKFIL